jgi:hypothetical protein
MPAEAREYFICGILVMSDSEQDEALGIPLMLQQLLCK